jgi:hypothetical protein
MTEADWLAATDPQPMLHFLWSVKPWRRQMRRKLRFFACACSRRIWHVLDSSLQETVETAERYADGEISVDERQGALTRMWDKMLGGQAYSKPWEGYATRAAILTLLESPYQAGVRCQQEALWAVAWYREPQSHFGVSEAQEIAATQERIVQADMLRDLHQKGRLVINPTWRTSAVLALSWQMYDSRDFTPMPVLADALQDAGCENPDILTHCRSDSPHVRGCWVVDMLLEKE